MKILHIHPSLQSGGAEAMVCNLCNEMVKRNEVSFCSIFEPKSNDVFFNNLDKSIKKYTLHKSGAGMDYSMPWKIYKFIKNNKHDVVNIHGFFYYYFIAVVLLHNKCKFFYTVHSDANMENTVWDKKILSLKKYCFRKGWMSPITISKESKCSFDSLYGIDSKCIYNGTNKINPEKIDLSKYKFSSRTRILFHPARITKAKNQVVLCEQCQRLINEGYDIVLIIAGLNQDNDIYTKISKYFSERIVYLGERKDVRNIMASADAFVLSSIWEGMPVTLLEALSVGCIPICTPVGGIPEAIKNGVSGFLAKTNKSEDFYIALKLFLDTPDANIPMIKEAVKKEFEKFNIENTALKYEEYYQIV